MDVFKTPIVGQSKMTSCTKQVSNRKAALFFGFSRVTSEASAFGIVHARMLLDGPQDPDTWTIRVAASPSPPYDTICSLSQVGMLFCRPRGCPPGYTTVILISSFPHTLHANFLRTNINIYLQFISFLHNIMTQIVEILSWCKTRNYLFYIVSIMEPVHKKYDIDLVKSE